MCELILFIYSPKHLQATQGPKTLEKKGMKERNDIVFLREAALLVRGSSYKRGTSGQDIEVEGAEVGGVKWGYLQPGRAV